MVYKFNPKLTGSGIISCIPQTGRCPNNCPDCFFQSGRSYLEPLEKNLPNMPSIEDSYDRIVRVNDGNDSNVDRRLVMESVRGYSDVFYNTAIPKDLAGFGDPVVLTVNPGNMTDVRWHKVEIPENLMMVRVRTNTWNLGLVDEVVKYYTGNNISAILTFMAYEKRQPQMNDVDYIHRKRTMNEYFAISSSGWRRVMDRYQDNYLVYSCGREGERGKSGCQYCGNCLREYYRTMERIRG